MNPAKSLRIYSCNKGFPILFVFPEFAPPYTRKLSKGSPNVIFPLLVERKKMPFFSFPTFPLPLSDVGISAIITMTANKATNT